MMEYLYNVIIRKMKKCIFVIAMLFATVYLPAQTNKAVFNFNYNDFFVNANHYDYYIPTSIYDTIGTSLYDVEFGVYQNLHGDRPGLTVCAIKEASAFNDLSGQITTGFAQLMYTDTLLDIGGISFFINLDYQVSSTNIPQIRHNVGDTLLILDNNFDVLYEKVLNDTINKTVPNAFGGFYEIILDSSVQVQGEYYIAYKYHSNNVVIFNNYCYSYNIPLAVYSSLLYAPNLSYTYKSHNKQIYYYNNDVGWLQYSDYKNHYNIGFEGMTTIETSSFSNIWNQDMRFPTHTTDIATFAIPEYAIARQDTTTEDTTSCIASLNDCHSITLYPNPTTSNATLTVEGLNEEATIMLTDVQGRTIANTKLAQGQTTTTIETSDLTSGVYYIRLITSTTTRTEKLIKK